MNAGHEVVDIGGRIWFARPDTNGLLPSGEQSWEWGVVAMLDSAADLDREALRVLDETEGWG
jgi:hypothetical protein